MPTSTSQRPANDGDRYAFAGTRTQSITFDPYAGATEPAYASPLPSTAAGTTTQSIAQAVTVSYPASYDSVSNLYDVHDIETDTGALSTSVTTSDSYEQYVTGPRTTVYEVGSVAQTSNGDVLSTTYGGNAFVIDEIPDVPGTIASGPSAVTTVLTDPDGQANSRSTNTDGSYVAKSAFVDGASSTATENADGTGIYSFPFADSGPPVQPPNSTFTVGAPAAGTIPISIVYLAAGAAPMDETFAPAVWYPNGSAVPLATRTLAEATAASIPAACDVAPALVAGRTPGELVEHDTAVDTIFGELEATTIETYSLSGLGPVCVMLSDTLASYYDFTNLNQEKQIAVSSVPFGTTVTTETLSLESATIAGPDAAIRTFPAPALAKAAGGAVAASFRSSIERARVLRHARLIRLARTHGGRSS